MANMDLRLSSVLHVTLLLFSHYIHCSQGDFYTSIYKLSLLITEESRLITALQKYIDEVTQAGRDVSHELYSILQRSKEEQLEIENSDTYPQNPINAFHLLYRIHKDWTKVHDIIVSCEDCIDSHAAKDFDISYHVAGKHIGGLPTEKDLIGAAQSIVGLWDTYQFDLKLFFDGYLFGRKTKPLSAEEILYITRRADAKDDIYEAYYWLTELLRRFKNGEYKDSGIREVTVAKALAGVYNKNSMPWKALEVIEAYPGEASLSRDLSYYKMRAQGIKQDSRKSFKRRKYSKPITKFHLRYESLCRGDIKSSKAAAHLHCYWRSSAIPYRLVKEEVVNIDPRIVLFHDVIYEDEISFLQNKSIDKIERSSVLGLQGGSALDESRISQTAWLSDLEYPLLATLARRIEMITGLSTKHKPFHCESEAFQVLNYGVGGMYESHYDPLGYRLWHSVRPEDPVECRGSGDRIATWMFYLTDIEVGGATVFPLVKTRVAPEKGAAAFWYNFKRDGEQDYDTQHAGCPVLLGTKWVSNKWIREEGQMQRRPCGLHKKDIDSLHSNNLFMQWML